MDGDAGAGFAVQPFTGRITVVGRCEAVIVYVFPFLYPEVIPNCTLTPSARSIRPLAIGVRAEYGPSFIVHRNWVHEVVHVPSPTLRVNVAGFRPR